MTKDLIQLKKDINEKFTTIGGFDITDIDPCKTRKKLRITAREHINWFRNWAEEAAQHMERVMHDNFTLDEMCDSS